MELFELQTKLLNNECPKVLLFVGEDYALVNMYIDKIAQKYSYVKYESNDLQTVIDMSKTVSIIEDNKLFVIKYNKELIAQENLWVGLEKKLHNNRLIIVYENIDKRTRFYNEYKENIVNFGVQNENVYIDMLKRSSKLNNKNLAVLGKICGYNYGKSLTELDKIKQFAQAKCLSENEAFDILLQKEVLSIKNEDVIFDFVNSVLDANIDMYKYYIKLKKQYESNIKILSVLYSAFRNQFIVQTVNSPTVSSTGLTQYVISACLRRQGRYTDIDLRNALNIICDLEQGMKSGKYDEYMLVDNLLARLLL